MSQDERAKFVAMAAGTPELFAPGVVSPAAGSQGESAEDEQAAYGKTEAEFDSAASSEAPTSDAERTTSQASVPRSATSHEQRSTFRVGTNEVEVDLVVTDSRGHAVRGLSAADFKIQEDGRPQKIRYFHEFATVAKEASPAATHAPSAQTAANVFSNKVLRGPDQALVAVVLDFVNTPVESQQYAKEELLKFLRKKPAGMQFALFAMGERLEMLHGFTADENLLLATVNSKKSTARFSRQLGPTIDLTTLIAANKERAAIDVSNQTAVQHLVHLQAEMRAGDLDRRVRLTMDAFSQLARYLACPAVRTLYGSQVRFPVDSSPVLGLAAMHQRLSPLKCVAMRTI